MPGSGATILGIARTAAVGWRALLRTSRPSTWPLPALAFLVAAVDGTRAPSVAIVLGTLLFLFPYGLLRHGLDRSAATGAAEAGAGESATGAAGTGAAGSAPDAAGRVGPAEIRLAIAVTLLPLAAAVIALAGAGVGIVLAAAIALAIAESRPPLRLRERPFLDVLAVAAGAVTLPALAGSLVGDRMPGDLPWLAIAAATTWGVGAATIAALDRGWRSPADRVGIATALRPRAGAVVALVGGVAAVGLTALLGSLGVVTAIGIASGLLVPLMILAGPEDGGDTGGDTGGGAREAVATTSGDRPRAGTPRAGSPMDRALREGRALAALAAIWTGAMLLAHWAVVPSDPWTVGIAVGTAATTVGLFNVVAVAVATMRRRVPAALQSADAAVPSLAIIVPSHDAAAVLPTTLAALGTQTYADASILVVDVGSADGSAESAAAWVGADAVLRAPDGPTGWTRRERARHAGAEAVGTDLVMFVDPGTVLAPIAARVLVEQLQVRDADLLVAIPRDAMPSHRERATVPGFALLRASFAPLWWPALSGRGHGALAFSDGPLVLVRRAVYLSVGGDAPRPGRPRTRAGLARILARAGSRVGVVRMTDLATTRRPASGPSVALAWRRRIVAYGGGSIAGALTIVGVESAAFLLPLALPPAALIAGVPDAVLRASFLPLTVLVLLRLALAVSHRQSAVTIVWHPVTIAVAIVGQLAGIVDHVRGRRRS